MDLGRLALSFALTLGGWALADLGIQAFARWPWVAGPLLVAFCSAAVYRWLAEFQSDWRLRWPRGLRVRVRRPGRKRRTLRVSLAGRLQDPFEDEPDAWRPPPMSLTFGDIEDVIDG